MLSPERFQICRAGLSSRHIALQLMFIASKQSKIYSCSTLFVFFESGMLKKNMC